MTRHQNQTHPGRSSARRRILTASLFAGFVLAVLVFFNTSGCLDVKPTTKKSGSDDKKCNSRLQDSFELADPQKLNFSSQPNDVVNQLNDWQQSCAKQKAGAGKLDEEARKLLTNVVDEQDLKLYTQNFFDERDVLHIRNSLTLGKIKEFLLQRSAKRDDVAHAVTLFYFVVRNIALQDSDEDRLPKTFFRILLQGRGTAEDRAWVFAGLLRQLAAPSAPAVILQPRNIKPDDKNPPFLVGVLINDKVYLFDTRLGLPIPSPADEGSTPLVRTPATLEQFVNNPSVAERLSVGKFQYPIAPADMKKPRVQLVGQRSLWSPHMQLLIGPLYDRCIVAQSLEDAGKTDGLISHVARYGRTFWSREDIEIWRHPFDSYKRNANLTAEERSRQRELFRPFEAPLVIGGEPGKAPTIKPTSKQLATRLAQLSGDHAKAIRSYVNDVRGDCQNLLKISGFPTAYRNMLLRADDDAAFWIGLCQFEQFARLAPGDLGEIPSEEAAGILNSAANSIRNYHAKPPTESSGKALRTVKQWGNQAAYLLAVCSAAQGKVADARQLLEQSQEGHPQAHGNALLLARWKHLEDKPKMPKTKPKEKKPSAGREPVEAPRPRNAAPKK